MHIVNTEAGGPHYDLTLFVWEIDNFWDFEAWGALSLLQFVQPDGKEKSARGWRGQKMQGLVFVRQPVT